MGDDDGNIKRRVARTLKWNSIDRATTQVLYAVTGIILANVLTQEDFGLVGAVLVFQAFATIFVDSGFNNALLQRKSPTRLDYSTVLWFNIGIATALYALLFAGAPLIAWCFKGDLRLIPLSRVMLLSLIINAASIVQTNIMVKQMDVKMLAWANIGGMVAGSVVGIVLALKGFGAWAIVWQTLTLAAVKTAWLWLSSRWRPLLRFSYQALRSFFKVGFGVLGTTILNVLFQNIYSFFIGNRNGLASLGYYTQADKWSKMGIASLAQVLNVSFIPVLSQYQDDPEKFAAATAKMNRLTAYLALPCMVFLAAMAQPIFHILFGQKWDGSIVLFQLLLVRGIFTVLTSQYNNYLLALGKARLMVVVEAVRDVLALAGILATLPFIGLEKGGDITYGLQIFIWGQVAASAVAWVVTLLLTARLTWRTPLQYLGDLAPYAVETAVIFAPMMWALGALSNPWLQLAAQCAIGAALYFGVNYILKSKIQKDAFDYLLKRKAA